MSVKPTKTIIPFPVLRALMTVVALFWISTAMATDEDIAALINASKSGDFNAAEALLDKGVDVNARNAKGSTALYGAAYSGMVDLAKLLLSKGANVNAKVSGVTPLIAAANQGHRFVVELLLANGADVTAKDDDGHYRTHVG